MWQSIKGHWDTFANSFHDSEVIYWARLQLILGAGYTALQGVDISVFISDRRLLQGYIFANALITECLRRRREDFGGNLK